MRRLHLALPIALVVLGACALADSGAAASASSYRCAIGSGHGYGYTKLISLSVRGGVSCSLGEYLARAHGHAAGWKCTGALIHRTKTAVERRVTCTMPKFTGTSIQWIYH